jgi:2-polyprenyl-3-methyl-5-hydroxy-6-metoxy-1,4-benzoquinol methylase
VLQRLTTEFGLSVHDARWLIENRTERHDAMLPMLPPERTELHLRRYELAATLAAGKRVLDAASGTGYGAALLARCGAASVDGIELDAAAVDYARRRFARPWKVAFHQGDVTRIDMPSRSFDLITSFETVEHLREPDLMLAHFARLLAPGGTLIISTPNDCGPTPHHFHSFTHDSFRTLLMRHFLRLEWYGQVAGDAVRSGDLPPGMFPLGEGWPRPDFFIVMASVPKVCDMGAHPARSAGGTRLPVADNAG